MVDHDRLRLMQRAAAGDLTEAQVLEVLTKVGTKHRWMHVEKLNEFDGAPGFTKAQGED
jgi:isocitrate dehydrogenase